MRTCPECGQNNQEDSVKCSCSHAVLPETASAERDGKQSSFGAGTKFIIVFALTSIILSVVSYNLSSTGSKFPNEQQIAYHVGSGIGQMLFLFVIFLTPALLFNYFSKKNKTQFPVILLRVVYFTAAIQVLLMMGNIYGHKKSVKQVTNSFHSELVTFPGCEFNVYFPGKTKQKEAFVKDIRSLIVESVYDGKSPYMRAECLPLTEADPNNTIISDFRQVLENQARMAGIQNPEIIIEKSNKKGIVGTYSGIKKAEGFDIKLFGKLVVGSESLLSLLTIDDANTFPSEKAMYFLNTVEKK